MEAARPERATYDLGRGDRLSLYGDLLNPGSETALGERLAASIAHRSDVDAEVRAALQAYVAQAISDGRLNDRFAWATGPAL